MLWLSFELIGIETQQQSADLQGLAKAKNRYAMNGNGLALIGFARAMQ